MFANETLVEEHVMAQEIDTCPETRSLSSGLDFYKPTMSQLAYEREPNTEVTFSFLNRGEQRLMDYIDPISLQHRFDELRDKGFSSEELQYLASLKNSDGSRTFSDSYLTFLRYNELPEVRVNYDPAQDDLFIDTTGLWAMATFWETIVMSEVNEAYFEGYILKNNIGPDELFDEGFRRLNNKINTLNNNPGIKFADFGTRRHFSEKWQGFVLENLRNSCPGNFIGTSNVEFSAKFGTKPVGTFAHEMPMVYAALAEARGEDVRASHGRFLEEWQVKYGKDYLIALTDTFGTDFFFEDFTEQQATEWKGLRHDSGDPYEFCERAIKFYKDKGIDPSTKTIVFSDGLDIDAIVNLYKTFNGRVNVLFGWGTTLTNDLGIKALNIVMKATHVKDLKNGVEADTVKISDDPGKHTGPLWLVQRYINKYFKAVKE